MKTAKKKATDILYQRTHYKALHPRKKTIEDMDASERKRFDHTLVYTQQPITQVAKRFGIGLEAAQNRLSELGYKTGVYSRADNTQERIPLAT